MTESARATGNVVVAVPETTGPRQAALQGLALAVKPAV